MIGLVGKSFLEGLIDKYVRPYAEVSPQQLQPELAKGFLELKDLTLRKEAFDALALPLTVKSGRISLLRIHVPWTKLRAQPSKVELDGLELVLEPLLAQSSAELKAQRLSNERAEDLLEDWNHRVTRIQGAEEGTSEEQSLILRLISSALSSLHVSVTNLHIRYEDSSSGPNPIAAGITLDKLTFETVDGNLKACELSSEADVINKLFNVQGLGIYWQHDLKPFQKPAEATANTGASWFSSKPKNPEPGQLEGAFWVLVPVGGEALLSLNRRGTPCGSSSKARIECKVKVEEVCLKVDCAVMKDAAFLVDAAVLNANRHSVITTRPAGSYAAAAKEWWTFAIQEVLIEVRKRRKGLSRESVLDIIRMGKKYYQLFRKKLISGNNFQIELPEAELSEMKQLEDDLPLHTIFAWRGRVEEAVEEEGILQTTGNITHSGTNGSGTVGLFSRMFRGWKRNNDGKQVTELAGCELQISEEDLMDFCWADSEDSFTDLVGPGAKDNRFAVSVAFPRVVVQMCDQLGHTGPSLPSGAIATIKVENFNFELLGKCSDRPGGMGLPIQIDASLDSVVVVDHVTTESSYPHVVCLGLAAGGEQFLKVCFEDQPTENPAASYLLSVKMGCGSMIYSTHLISRIHHYLDDMNRVDVRALTGLLSRKAAASVEQQRLLTQRMIREALEQRKPFDIQLDLTLPDLVMPASLLGQHSSIAPVGILQLGKLTAFSKVQAEGGGPYDQCEMVLQNLQLQSAQSVDDWKQGNVEAVLDVAKICLDFDVLVARKDMDHLQLKMTHRIPTISWNISSRTLHRFTSLSLAVTHSSVAPPSRKLEASEVSTLVGMAMSGIRVLDQAWATLRRRETLGMFKGSNGASQQRKYADWGRIHYELKIDQIFADLVEVSNSGDKKLLQLRMKQLSLDALVRSLDANAVISVESMEMEDFTQTFGDDYKFLIGSTVRSAAADTPEQLLTGKIHYWDRKSPDRKDVDVEMETLLAQVYVGVNLKTFGIVQNCLAEAIEKGITDFGSNIRAEEEQAQAVDKDFDARMDAGKKQAELMGMEVEKVQKANAKPLALRFTGTTYAVDVSLYAERNEVVFPVALLQFRKATMDYHETRKGRIDVKASLAECTLLDATPAGTKYNRVWSKVDGVSTQPLIEAEYIHFGKESKERTDAKLTVTTSPLSVTLCSRFLAEAITYVNRSAVFRSNFAAITSAASTTSKFRQRLDSSAMGYRYRISMSVAVGGVQIQSPESSTSDNKLIFEVPKFDACNEFIEDDKNLPAERLAVKVDNVRLLSRIADRDEDMITFGVSMGFLRHLGSDLPCDIPVMDIWVNVAAIKVVISQPQVAFLWRAIFAQVAEVKSAWLAQRLNTIHGGSRSILDIKPIREALAQSMRNASEEERERQALAARASGRMLDLQLSVQLESLSISILGPESKPVPLACLEVTNVVFGMKIFSNTAYALEGQIGSLKLSDVDQDSGNLHRVLVSSSQEKSDTLLSVKYTESGDGSGALFIEFTGVRFVVAADPIFAVLSTVFNAFTSVESENGKENKEIDDEAGSITTTRTEHDGGYHWPGDTTFSINLNIGLCEISILQDCKVENPPRIVFSFVINGLYQGSKEVQEAKLNVCDIQLYNLLPELPEPLHILDRTNCTTSYRKTPEDQSAAPPPDPSAGPKTIICVGLRSLDFVLTYQDIKRMFAIYRAFQSAAEKSGFTTSTGIQYITSLMEREDKDSDKIEPAGNFEPGSGTVKFELKCELLSVCLINDCMGWTVPFATMTGKGISIESLWLADLSMQTTCLVTLDASFYNIMNTCFEPIMEPWALKVEITEAPGRLSGATKVSADTRIELDISEMHMRGVVQTVESWIQDGKNWGEQKLEGDTFSPYRLRNEAGIPLTFWLGSSLEPPGGSECKSLASGGEEPFQFSQKRALQARQRDMNIEFHTLSIKFEGIEDVLTHVPVDIIGVHMLPLGDLRAVAEIHNDSGSKIIAIQSTFKIYNKTSIPVEAAACAEVEKPESWSETYAGDFHGCVPLNLSDSKFLKIRPGSGNYNYSDPFPVPVLPVTGESVFVECKPTDPSSGQETIFFRVRLDAKRPVGGHEENMRVVVSIHPALRLHNLLPYPLEASLYLAPGGKTSSLIGKENIEEGAVSQLYCANLKEPLHLSCSVNSFTKVKESVLVFHPDSNVSTAKTIQLIENVEGGNTSPLCLGIETTLSAWGDMTVVVYAQYLIRNFTTLPLLFAPYARAQAIKAAPGQTVGADNSLNDSRNSMDYDHHTVLNAMYAGFGPRSQFHGKAVAVVPPLADKDITNADEVRGNVAVIIRGIVPFTQKARRAAAAGAIGVIFINSDDSSFLAEGDNGPGIRIPCVMVTNSEGKHIDTKSAEASIVNVVPEAASRSQRATSQLLEWKRLVKAHVRVGEASSSRIATSPAPQFMADNELAKQKDKEIDFPDSWMSHPADQPLMFSYESFDLTGNKACFCVKEADWGPPFSLESMGTNGVLEVPGKATELAAIKGARPLYEFGLTFELGIGQFARSKVASIYPRYTIVNRMGYTLQIVQSGLEDIAGTTIDIKQDEVLPIHWMDDRKAKTFRARIVPTIGSQETFHTGWSGALQPDQVGSFAVRFPPEKPSEPALGVLVTIKLRKSAAFIVFRKESEEKPQYAVCNKSSKVVKVWQEGSDHQACGLRLEPGNRTTFCWDRPHDPQVIVLAQENSKDLQKIKMNKFSEFQIPGGLWAEVIADGPTRALQVRDQRHTAEQSSVGESKAAEESKYTVEFALSGFGVSVVDAKLEEVLYASLLDISSVYRITKTDYEFELKIGKLQIDNQTEKGPEVVLGPDVTKSQDRPTIHISMVKSRIYKDMAYYKILALFIREMDLDLEETFIMRLLDAAQNVVDSSTITVPEEKTEDLRSSGFKQLKFLRKEASTADRVYFELLQLHPIVVNLSFYGTGAMMQRASTEGGGLSYNPMFAAMKALGVVITNIDRAPIALNALALERPFATQQELLSVIRKHYRSQLITQLYKLVGSFEFLGNPVGLVNNLGTGFQDFFYEPAQGAMKSPSDFAKGMSKGSLSLFKNSTYGLFNAASKITGSMSKSLVQLSGDEDYIKKRQEAQSARVKAKQTNITKERQDLATEASDGFMGIFAKPLAGAREAGASGFLSGLGKGLLGAVVKPTAGLMDLTSMAAEGVRDTTKSSDDILRRVRPPRVNLGDGILRHYDARSAHGCDAMRRLRDGEWKDHRYIGFCALEGTDAALVTDKHVCVHHFENHEEKWESPVTSISQVAVDNVTVHVACTPPDAKPSTKSMVCTDTRYAAYLGEAIQRAVSLASAESMRRGGSAKTSEYML